MADRNHINYFNYNFFLGCAECIIEIVLLKITQMCLLVNYKQTQVDAK